MDDYFRENFERLQKQQGEARDTLEVEYGMMNKYTDEQLQELEEKHNASRDALLRSIELHEWALERLRTELERRELEAFWAAHPELLRLQVGDKVLVTPLIHRLYSGYGSGVGRILIIQRFIKRNGSDWIVDFGVRTLVKLGDVQQMRRAWLEREKGSVG